MPNDRGKQEASGSRGRGSSGSAMLLAAAEATTATAAVAEEREKKKRQKRRDSKTRALFFFHFISFCAIGLLTVCVERQNVSKCNQNTRTHRTHTITPIGRVCVRTKDRERKKRVRSSLVCVRCWECVCICVELNSTNDGEFDDTVSRTHAHKMVVGSACGEFERTQRNHFCLCARRRLCLSECVCVCIFVSCVRACACIHNRAQRGRHTITQRNRVALSMPKQKLYCQLYNKVVVVVDTKTQNEQKRN